MITREVTAWYLDRYHGTADDPGVLAMFLNPVRVGHFAVTIDDLKHGRPGAFFRLLVATTMFQRRQDQQIQGVLRGIRLEDVEEMTDAPRLRVLSMECACPHGRSLSALTSSCDLTKTADGRATCGAARATACALKRHSELLKRYGHFGKVPTALAHVIHEAGATDLPTLYAAVVRNCEDPARAAEQLEVILTRAWRVSDKIAAMYLSMLSNPDLSEVGAPWCEGLDWHRWVVIDSNVDLFLRAIGYRGSGTYGARRTFLQSLAGEIDLGSLKPGLRAFNPRIVQQAAYLFMSATNRRASRLDCSHVGALACKSCPPALSAICPREAHAHRTMLVPQDE